MADSMVIDVHTLPQGHRHEEIRRRFDALPTGGSLQLLTPHRPNPLLLELQKERSGQFDWNVLEDGPERFRTELVRRTGATSRNATEYLESDHRRLDAILTEARRLAAAGSLPQARAQFAEFTCGLGRHIRVEEAILFPVFEEASGMSGGPTHVMRSEHVEILRWMDSAEVSLSKDDAAGFLAASDNLGRVLGAHNMKEERILYPMTDGFAGDDGARDELVRQMQAF